MSKSKKVQYPECEKLNSVSEESNKIGEFLDWLLNETDVVLCEYDADDGYFPTTYTFEKLLALYFDIDLNKVEKERREILKGLGGN